MDGLLLVDKPTGVTSFDVVRRVRKVADTGKVGHTGTLDPQASGLLPIVLGKCTRLAKFLSLDIKEYAFELELGAETETGDIEGEAVRECPWEHVTEEDVREACERFVGDIEQVPPLYSAIKVDGKRAYELAREGVDFELEPRRVYVERLELRAFEPPRASLYVRCGSGTYVRALSRDIGGAVSSCAFTTAIRRTLVGRFRIEEATPLTELTSDTVHSHLLPPVEVMRGVPHYDAAPSECRALGYGQRIPITDLEVAPGAHVAVTDQAGELVAVTRVEEGPHGLRLKPERVLKAE